MTDTTVMSDVETTPAADDEHGHGHAPAGEPLGAIDWEAWAYAVAGSLLGLLTVLALFVARGA